MTQATLTIAPNGRVIIPATMRAKLRCRSGGKIIARLIDGALILEPIDTAVRRAQVTVRNYLPADAALADDLIAERHQAARDE